MTTRPHVALDGQYSITETAMLLGKDRKTIYNWCKQGYLKAKRHRYNKRQFVMGREILRIYDSCL